MSLDVYLEKSIDLGGPEPHVVEVFNANVTHNLTSMAAEGGFYEALWRPEEIGARTAKDLISPLRVALHQLINDPERFRRHDPPNGWGSYEVMVSFVKRYLAACERYPLADVRVWR